MNEFRNKIRALKGEFPLGDSALIPAIHRAEADFGALTQEAAVAIAEELGTAPEHVTAVASFYHLIKREQTGKFHFLVCSNLSCMICGAYDLLAWLEKELGVPQQMITPDGLFSYEETECIGACDMAPAVLVNGQRMGPLNSQGTLSRLLDSLRKEAGNA